MMNEQIECPQCHQTYSQDNPPKILVNCKHNLCLKCLQEQIRTDVLIIVCPLDRTRIQLRRFTLAAFKTNEQLLSSLTIKQQNSSEESCSKESSRKSTPKQTVSSNAKKSKSSKKIIEEPKKQDEEDEIQVAEFSHNSQEQENLETAEQQIAPYIPQKSPQIQKKQSFSPKKQAINFQMCLLHSKKADLICIEDKGIICASCGLFGEHKLHQIIPYENFLSQYSNLAEECFRNYQQLQSRSEKMNIDIISEKITDLLSQKRGEQLKNIKNFIKQLNESVKNVEKQLISNLDVAINYKKTKMKELLNFAELIQKRDQYMVNVQSMTEGLQCLFNLQHVEKYIPFIDPNHQKSYIQEEGEYLIRQIDNYCKNVQQKLEESSTQFSISFKTVDPDLFKALYSINSIDSKQISQAIQKNKKEVQQKALNSLKPYTPSRSKSCKDTTIILGKSSQKKLSPIKQNDDYLLLQINSKSGSPEKKQNKNISPIHPLTNFQSFEQLPQCSMGPQFFLKVAEPPLPHNKSKKAKAASNKTLNPCRLSKTKLLENSQNILSQSSTRPRSKPKSNNNSNHMTERELLSVLNEKCENKKKKKIELPQKYLKIYEDLQKDKLQILDLGGAFLGDNTILTITEQFASFKCKLKQVKLMNNKISDQAFPQLVHRCKFIPSLNLSYNLLTQKSLEWLLTEVEHLGDLRNITLSNNKIVLRNNRDRIEELKRKGINVSL